MNIIIKLKKMKSKEMDKLTEELNELSRKASKATGKEKEDLVKRKCFACNKEKAMGKFERYCSDSCRSRATRYYQAPNSISW